MGSTRSVSDTFLARAKRDPDFRAALIAEAIELLAENDVGAAKRIIRDYVLASIGFTDLAKHTGKKKESLMRMLSEKGNPTVNNLAAVLSCLTSHEGISIHVEATR